MKTSAQANISDDETLQNIISLVKETIDNKFKLVMVRPKFVSLAKQLIESAKSNTLVGTVIGFHEDKYAIQQKLMEASLAIENDIDDLDFVINLSST